VSDETAPPCYGPRSLIHPNLTNLIEPPIALVAGAVDRIGGRPAASFVRASSRRLGFATAADNPAFTTSHAVRAGLALSVAPLAAAVRNSFLFLTFDLVGLDLGAALLATLLATVSASGLLFGAIPESFGLSGAGFAILLHLVARSATGARPASTTAWVVVGTLLTSITIVNVAPFALAAATAFFARERRAVRALVRATLLGLAALAATALLFLALTPLEGASLSRAASPVEQSREIELPRSAARAVRFPVALLDTLAPPLPNTLSSSGGGAAGHDPRVVRFTFRDDLDSIAADDRRVAATERPPAQPWRRAAVAALLAAALLFALVRLRAAPPKLRIVAAAALAILVFNALLHTCFGLESFLYSQHWHAALIVVLAVGMVGDGLRARIGRVALLVLVVVAAIHSLELFAFIGARL
jgi:hypothetical protein